MLGILVVAAKMEIAIGNASSRNIYNSYNNNIDDGNHRINPKAPRPLNL